MTLIAHVGQAEGGTATFIGTIVALTLSVAAWYWYTKRLFDTTEQVQRTAIKALEAMQKTFEMTIDKLLDDRKADREASAERHAAMHKTIITLARQNARGVYANPKVVDHDEETPPC